MTRKPEPVIASHVSPYRRIEIGARPPTSNVAATEGALAKAIREAAAEKQHIESIRIWNHVVQTARGCNATTGETGE